MPTIEQIKDLRNLTGAGVNAIREALEKSKGDFDLAVKYLREKGIAKAEKRKDNVAKNGILGTYVHSNSKLVVVVEIACETDFAANSADMKRFAQDLALHVAAMNPKYISVDTVDATELENEKQVFVKELEGKPEQIKEKILQGKLEKFYKENVLLRQPLFQDDKKTVEDYLNEMVAKIGEKMVLSKFYKIQVAENTVSSQVQL